MRPLTKIILALALTTAGCSCDMKLEPPKKVPLKDYVGTIYVNFQLTYMRDCDNDGLVDHMFGRDNHDWIAPGFEHKSRSGHKTMMTTDIITLSSDIRKKQCRLDYLMRKAQYTQTHR